MATESDFVKPKKCLKKRKHEKSIEICLLKVFCFISISISGFSYVDALGKNHDVFML
jgi:hypothetical protein